MDAGKWYTGTPELDSEREPGLPYLCIAKDSDGDTEVCIALYGRYGWAIKSDDPDAWMYDDSRKVVAWMEIPEWNAV